jgi:putative Mn2+ efflux pump MntP
MLLSEIIIIAFGLSLDAFAVSIGAGAVGTIENHRGAVRLAFHFGLFQFLMPVLGWYLGLKVEPYV